MKLVDHRSQTKGILFSYSTTEMWILIVAMDFVDGKSCHEFKEQEDKFMEEKVKYKDRIFGSGIPEPQVYYREVPFHTLLILFHKNLILKYLQYLGLDGPLQVELVLCDIFQFTVPISAT